MPRAANSSPQTQRLLEALLARPSDWRYGYDLSKETDLKSGTLYPLLMRLEAQSWLETRWTQPEAPGRPPRHLYQLTPLGAKEGRLALRAMHRRIPVLRSAKGTLSG